MKESAMRTKLCRLFTMSSILESSRAGIVASSTWEQWEQGT